MAPGSPRRTRGVRPRARARRGSAEEVPGREGHRARARPRSPRLPRGPHDGGEDPPRERPPDGGSPRLRRRALPLARRAPRELTLLGQLFAFAGAAAGGTAGAEAGAAIGGV